MARVKYEPAPDVCKAIDAILASGVFPHIPRGFVKCVRSRGSRSLAIARVYGLPKPWIVALGHNPGYVVEVLSERFDPLSPDRKIEVLVHELLHIPSTLGGGLRPHGRLVNDRRVRNIVRRLRGTPYYEIAVRALDTLEHSDR